MAVLLTALVSLTGTVYDRDVQTWHILEAALRDPPASCGWRAATGDMAEAGS